MRHRLMSESSPSPAVESELITAGEVDTSVSKVRKPVVVLSRTAAP